MYRFLLFILYLAAVQYLLGYLTLMFTRHSAQGVKLPLVAGAGGVLSVFACLLQGGYRLALIGVMALVIALLLTDRFSLSAVAAHLAVYGMVTLCFIGCAAAIMLAGGETLQPYVPIALCFAIVAVLALGRVVARLNRRTRALLYAVEAQGRAGEVKAKGYYDSGNVLYYNDMPVVVISQRLFGKLGVPSDRQIAITTVGGVQNLPLIPLSCKIYYAPEKNMVYHIYAAVSRQIDGRNYDVLLHRDMGGNNEPIL